MNVSKLSFKKAALKILERTNKPMTAAEITKIAVDENLIDSIGETPEATMAAQIYVDIKKDKNSPFRKIGKGLFILKKKSNSTNSPAVFVEDQNELTKSRLKEKVHSMDPFQFEYLIGDLLKEIGYENVIVTKSSGDKGIDVIANLTVGGITDVKTVIQVKRYKVGNKITGATIAQLRGSAEVDQRGLVITTSDFTKDALLEAKAANKMPISLINGERLFELLIKYEIGIRKEKLELISIDDSYFQNDSPEEPRKTDFEKNRSIWPLPGGTTNYIETLNRFLEQIIEGNNTKRGLINWYVSNFENVVSENTTQGYINVPKSMGITKFENGKYSLTEEGKLYFENKSKEYLYEITNKNILAFGDIFEFIKNSSSPVKEEQILEYLKENFDIDWKTFAQITFRVLWLINMGKISKSENGYSILQ